jgi:RHS repeat-associated protein
MTDLTGAAPATYYYSQDGLGSVRTLTDGSGMVANRYDYTAFGETYHPTTSETVDNRYTYTGRERNQASGTHYMRYRTQDPVTGRFLTRDPAYDYGSQDGNFYSYVGNAPYRYVDPWGLSAEDCCDDCKKGEIRNCRVSNYQLTPWGVTPSQEDAADAAAKAVDETKEMIDWLNTVKGVGGNLAKGVSLNQSAGELAAETASGKAQGAVGGMPNAQTFVKAWKGINGKRFGYHLYIWVNWEECQQEDCTKEEDKGKKAWTWSGTGEKQVQCTNGYTHSSGDAYKTKKDAFKAIKKCAEDALKECNEKANANNGSSQ